MTALSDVDFGQRHNLIWWTQWLQEPFQMDVFQANTPSHA